MTRIKNENAPIPPPRKSLNSSRENTPKKKKHQTSHVKEFTIENFVNQVLFWKLFEMRDGFNFRWWNITLSKLGFDDSFLS